MSSKLLAGRVAIITGSGRGIGRAIAGAFAAEGASVVLVARSEDELKKSQEEISKAGGSAYAIPADISSRRDVESAVKQALEKYPKIDILVNNAGVARPIGPLVSVDSDEWMQNVMVNLAGTFFFTKAVLPSMIKNRYGKIVNLAGGGAFKPLPNFSAYSASKAAVVRLTETVAAEVKEYNIHANAMDPGMVPTKMFTDALKTEALKGEEYERRIEKAMSSAPERFANAAQLALMLVTCNLTGRTIHAIWDDWKAIPGNEESIMKSDMYTMKRVAPTPPSPSSSTSPLTSSSPSPDKRA